MGGGREWVLPTSSFGGGCLFASGRSLVSDYAIRGITHDLYMDSQSFTVLYQ